MTSREGSCCPHGVAQGTGVGPLLSVVYIPVRGPPTSTLNDGRARDAPLHHLRTAQTDTRGRPLETASTPEGDSVTDWRDPVCLCVSILSVSELRLSLCVARGRSVTVSCFRLTDSCFVIVPDVDIFKLTLLN